MKNSWEYFGELIGLIVKRLKPWDTYYVVTNN